MVLLGGRGMEKEGNKVYELTNKLNDSDDN